MKINNMDPEQFEKLLNALEIVSKFIDISSIQKDIDKWYDPEHTNDFY